MKIKNHFHFWDFWFYLFFTYFLLIFYLFFTYFLLIAVTVSAKIGFVAIKRGNVKSQLCRRSVVLGGGESNCGHRQSLDGANAADALSGLESGGGDG
jgi:hypothetical protein